MILRKEKAVAEEQPQIVDLEALLFALLKLEQNPESALEIEGPQLA